MTTNIDRKQLEEALDFYRDLEKGGQYAGHTKTLLDAAKAHLATLPEPPKTKIVQVWRVEYAWRLYSEESLKLGAYVVRDEEEARKMENNFRTKERCACVKLTGPHPQEIPDED